MMISKEFSCYGILRDFCGILFGFLLGFSRVSNDLFEISVVVSGIVDFIGCSWDLHGD